MTHTFFCVLGEQRVPTSNAEARAEEETLAATAAAVKVVGAENVITTHPPTMGSEDFAWMLQDHPGCYIRVGNGEGLDGGCVVHIPNYDQDEQAYRSLVLERCALEHEEVEMDGQAPCRTPPERNPTATVVRQLPEGTSSFVAEIIFQSCRFGVIRSGW